MEIPIKNEFLPIFVNENNLNNVMNQTVGDKKNVLMIVPATKPCFYKLWGVMKEASQQNIPFFILNPGQHYDDVIGHGFKEFGFDQHMGVDLRIRGNLSQKSSELFSKIAALVEYFQKRWPNTRVLPYTNGDTITAGIFPAAWMFSTNEKGIHGEAGLRGMSPKFFKNLNIPTDMEGFIQKQFNEEWELNRTEPFPEQYCTFIGSASTKFFFSPTKVNENHLINEGYPKEKIWTSGNTVVDVIALKQKEAAEDSVFDLYPKLENGSWLRVDVHRRGNLTPRRFKVIFDSINNMVNLGLNICFVELYATAYALEHYGLREKLINLAKENNNFLFTPLWKKYAHVIEFLKSDHCWSTLTDSGSMQEEMNELQKPCLTWRLNTDRPETIFDAKTNILVPPINSDFVSNLVKHVYKNEELRKQMSKGKKLYGIDVSKKIITKVKGLLSQENSYFGWSHEQQGLWEEKDELDVWLEDKRIKFL